MVNQMPLSTDNLTQLIRQKRRVLVQLREVATRQGQLVEAGDIAALMKLLAAKQKLITALQAVERQLAPYHDDDPEARVWPSPDHRAACAAEAAECSRLLAEVMEMEKAQEGVMTGRRDALAGRLQTAHAAHAVQAAYQTHSNPKSAGGIGAS